MAQHPNTHRISSRQKLGCWLNERWKTELAIRNTGLFNWLDLCNRHETLTNDSLSGGRIPQWQHSSRLTVACLFPEVGSRLLKRCLTQWPVTLNFGQHRTQLDPPQASVLIAIGGTDRIAQFRAVLASLRGQSHEAFEIIVVEQSDVPEINAGLPDDVLYVHSFKPPEVEFNKSWALNVAAKHASGQYLLIHDADYLVPQDYIAECCRVLERADGVRPSRFNFHLSESSTVALTSTLQVPVKLGVDQVIQNNPTPLGVRRDVYWQVGGHDESFVGWGGEDVEFWSRLQTTKMSEGGWLPTIHLWHLPAPRKESGHRNQHQQDEKLSISPSSRIQALRKLNLGGCRPATKEMAAQ